jgi:hypothetical protein
MAGLPWIQLAADWKGHKKAVRLRVFLADEWAWAYVVSLWMWTAQHQGDGKIEGAGAVEVIADAAGWKGDSKHFVDCLVRAELIDETSDGFYVHDWHDYAGAHIAKRKKEQKRLRTYRERTRTKRVRNAYVHGEREREREKETEIISTPARLRSTPAGGSNLGPLGAELVAFVESGLGHGLIPAKNGQADELEALVTATSLLGAQNFIAQTCKQRDTEPKSVAWLVTVLRSAVPIPASEAAR